MRTPWKDPKNLITNESCINGKSHKLRLVFFTQTENSLPNTKSEAVYQCLVCGKYKVERHIHPKLKTPIKAQNG